MISTPQQNGYLKKNNLIIYLFCFEKKNNNFNRFISRPKNSITMLIKPNLLNKNLEYYESCSSLINYRYTISLYMLVVKSPKS